VLCTLLQARPECRTSTLCWSASFYPQPILNWQRKSTHGLAIDFPTVNVLGFVCYTISTLSLLYSPLIRRQYAERRVASSEPTVRLNDVAFAVHAVIMSALYYSQFWSSIWGFQVGRRQRLSRPIAGIFWGNVVAVLLIILLVLLGGKDGGRDATVWAWIDVV
jgi:cystinosin